MVTTLMELAHNQCIAAELRKKSVFILNKDTYDPEEFVIFGVWKCDKEEFIRYLLGGIL